MSTTSQRVAALDAEAKSILLRNDKGSYTIPTQGLYPYQWNWDSAFAAMGFAQFDVARAWTELDTLLAAQWDNGMVPHIVFHQIDPGYFPGPDVWRGNGPVASSAISQPPIAATMAKFVFDKDPVQGAVRLEPLFDKLLAWHQWFLDWRLDNGAVCITHPWEAGRDNAADWDNAMAGIHPVDVKPYIRRDTSHVDSAMRPTKQDYDRYLWLVQQGVRANWDEATLRDSNPFRVADPTMSFTLLRSHRDLAALGRLLGRDVSRIEQGISTLLEGVKTLWNESGGYYDSRDARSGRWSGCLSNAAFLCWYAGVDSAVMLEHFHAVNSEVDFGVPSLDPRDLRFDSKRYWRGPVWAIMNMLIANGMDSMGIAEGAELRESTAQLIANYGFAEYFDPLDGSPAGGQNFTWTAAVWLGWATPNASS